MIPPETHIDTGRRTIHVGQDPVIMGILNITPDSFSDGGRLLSLPEAVRQLETMAEAGAHILDVGGESSRPGAEPVSVQEELERVLPVIRECVRRTGLPVSIDTCKPAVARAALAEGAEIINDISGLRDPEMVALACGSGVAIAAMHMRGVPGNMQSLPPSADIMAEIKEFFAGILQLPLKKNTIILDPGIGFGKTVQDNVSILQRLGEFLTFQRPVLVGVSRKSFIGKLTGAPVEQRLPGSLAAAVLAWVNGARLIRCHDVPETLQALRVARAILPTEP